MIANNTYRQELERFLNDLCVVGGFCLREDASIFARDRWEAREFALEVLRLEGFPTPEYETRLLRQLVRRFTERFGRSVIRAEEFERDWHPITRPRS
jgi:hypothetical protein